MLLSAASLAFTILYGDQGLQKKDVTLWETSKPSVVTLLRNGVPFGQAALIDKSGWFIAHQSLMAGQQIAARAPDGRIVQLFWRSTDAPTQTVLLQAQNWPAGLGKVVVIHDSERLEKASVIVVLPDGPLRGELVSTQMLGVLNSTRKMFPLGEVHFETTAQSVAGGLVFDEAGHLVGLLNSTLEFKEPVRTQRIAAPNSKALNDIMQSFKSGGRGFGPGEVTVGYLVDAEVLRHVVAGFLSATHTVKHPAIGVYCKDAPMQDGALVESVREGSPAQAAGMQAGDIIVKMDDRSIYTQIDFARFIETKDVGDTVKVTVLRMGSPVTVSVKVGVFKSV